MRWEKLGLIFSPDTSLWWQRSHAQNPFPVALDNDVFRVFFASRDVDNVSRTGFFDLDMRSPFAAKHQPQTPLLDIGEMGAFDDCGAMPHSIIHTGAEYILYYTGWSKAVTTPFTFFIGAAKAVSLNGPFVRLSRAPVVGRSFFDPLLTAAPYVIQVDSHYLMFYTTATKWEKDENGNAKHYYHISSAISPDGITWAPMARPVIELEEGEFALARPVLFKNAGKFELWFSYRGTGSTYRIGKTVSKDLITWSREKVDIDVSPDGEWDSQMICYAHPFLYKNELYVLYNGNAYGATGVGLAKAILTDN